MLRSIGAALGLALARLRSGPGTAAGLVITMAAVASVWVAIPLYAESATSRLLSEQVDESDADGVPFGYLVSYNRLSGGNRSWADLGPLHDELAGDQRGGGIAFGASVSSVQRLAESIPFDIYSEADPSARAADTVALSRLSFASLSDLERVVIASGRLPEPSPAGAPLEIALHVDEATELGISSGQRLTAVNYRSNPEDPGWATPLVVTATWAEPALQDRQPDDRFVAAPGARNAMLVPEATMAMAVEQLADEVVANAQWLVLLDSSRVRTEDVDALLARTDGIARLVDDRLIGARILVNPERSLIGFQNDVERLERGLRVFALPTLALLFITLAGVVAMTWRRRDPEMTMLRRRGAPIGPLVVAAIIEALVLTAIAAGVALIGARLVAGLVARTETFLRFGDGLDVALGLNRRSLVALAVVSALLIIIQLIPAVRLVTWARQTRRRTSETRADAPWWQRRFVDLVVVGLIAAYAATALSVPVEAGDLLSSPVVILLPALLAVGFGLVVLRIFPLLMTAVAGVANRTESTAAVLAARRAARVSGTRFAPLLLLVVTGALSIFTASLARTLDLQLVDRAHHEVGAAASIQADLPTSSQRAAFDRMGLDWGPAADAAAFDRVWGSQGAARIAELVGRVERVGGATVAVNVVGVDATAFAAAAFWRDDYADRSLDELMALIDATGDSALVASSTMRANDLRIGDVVGLSATHASDGVSMDMVIVGSFDQFPTWTPGIDDLPPFVVSLTDLEQRFGEAVTQRVLFANGAIGGDGVARLRDDGQTRADLNRVGVSSRQVDRASDTIDRALIDPERQGIFGLLTLGFVVSTALTVAAFGMYSAFEYRRQRTELGMLRALGLGQRGLFAIVGLDLVFVVGAGLGAALAAGLAMSRWLLPRVVEGAVGPAPDLLVDIDQGAAAAIVTGLIIAFVLAYGVVLLALRRIRLFEAIKLGATDE